ncbi:MAG: ATP-binding cassette domain-containing protein, partial [Prevotella sp.]|nr:ATP-binding cassette domain-containing protein [Prevotella sp.]
MIILKDLTIGYRQKDNNKVVAEHINAQIEAGVLTCLIGPNGVGKSTLLRTLSAFQPPLGGKI